MSRRTKMGRGLLTFLCCVAAAPGAAHLLEGVHSDSLETSLLAGCLLGLIYLLFRPILRLLSMPIGCLTLGVFYFALDVALFMALPHLIPGFRVDGILWAALSALLVDGVCLIAGGWR